MYRTQRRRAVLAELLRAGQPLRPRDIVSRLGAAGHTVPGNPPKVVSDILRSQARLGRVHRIRRGWYELVPTAIPRSTLFRITRWETTPVEQPEDRHHRDHHRVW